MLSSVIVMESESPFVYVLGSKNAGSVRIPDFAGSEMSPSASMVRFEKTLVGSPFSSCLEKPNFIEEKGPG